jgi:hypothetical protein
MNDMTNTVLAVGLIGLTGVLVWKAVQDSQPVANGVPDKYYGPFPTIPTDPAPTDPYKNKDALCAVYPAWCASGGGGGGGVGPIPVASPDVSPRKALI